MAFSKPQHAFGQGQKSTSLLAVCQANSKLAKKIGSIKQRSRTNGHPHRSYLQTKFEYMDNTTWCYNLKIDLHRFALKYGFWKGASRFCWKTASMTFQLREWTCKTITDPCILKSAAAHMWNSMSWHHVASFVETILPSQTMAPWKFQIFGLSKWPINTCWDRKR